MRNICYPLFNAVKITSELTPEDIASDEMFSDILDPTLQVPFDILVDFDTFYYAPEVTSPKPKTSSPSTSQKLTTTKKLQPPLLKRRIWQIVLLFFLGVSQKPYCKFYFIIITVCGMSFTLKFIPSILTAEKFILF